MYTLSVSAAQALTHSNVLELLAECLEALGEHFSILPAAVQDQYLQLCCCWAGPDAVMLLAACHRVNCIIVSNAYRIEWVRKATDHAVDLGKNDLRLILWYKALRHFRAG